MKRANVRLAIKYAHETYKERPTEGNRLKLKWLQALERDLRKKRTVRRERP